ncbi:hypothetical protein ADUPG1_013116 [Aduncisulcus paluster]|uniref:Protein kinase domain-containing protein n=1 Tax=Aduncisulcus paluster TaxID=2918883 RepID=A0ABQ5K6K0_9EUKA|nr:hypothetical protein ADUPG1_013116 [Aduncisulcus paluster]
MWPFSKKVTKKAIFIRKGARNSNPILFDNPSLIIPEFSKIEAEAELEGPFDYSENARAIMTGATNTELVLFSEISVPFSSPQTIFGCYVCVLQLIFPSDLSLILKNSKGKRISVLKYSFPKETLSGWYFLPIDVPNVTKCIIVGNCSQTKGGFPLSGLQFVRKETSRERSLREEKEAANKELWSKAIHCSSTFIKHGKYGSILIPRSDPSVLLPNLTKCKAKNLCRSTKSDEYNVSAQFKAMLRGESLIPDISGLYLSHGTVPFASPSCIKAIAICLADISAPRMLFSFKLQDGTSVSKMYIFDEKPANFDWHFLSVNLDDVVSCKIEGKGTWKGDPENDQCFYILDLMFLRKETKEETAARMAKEQHFDKLFAETSAEFTVLKGKGSSIPISKDHPSNIQLCVERITGFDETKSAPEEYDKSGALRDLLSGKSKTEVELSNIEVRFSTPHYVKGAYICISRFFSTPSFFLMLSHSNGTVTAKKYKLPWKKHNTEWHYLPIDSADVVSCDMYDKKTCKTPQVFHLSALMFTEKPESKAKPLVLTSKKQTQLKGTKEKKGKDTKLITTNAFSKVKSTPKPSVKPQKTQPETKKYNVVKPIPKKKDVKTFISDSMAQYETCKAVFLYDGFMTALPLYRDDTRVISPNISKIKGINRTFYLSDPRFDCSKQAQQSLIGHWHFQGFTDVSVPFNLPSDVNGAYIFVGKEVVPHSFLFTFTLTDGKQISKLFEFPEIIHFKNWFFLPIGVKNVNMCHITSTNMEYDFALPSLVFIREESKQELYARKAKEASHEKKWSEATVVQARFLCGPKKVWESMLISSYCKLEPKISKISSKNRSMLKQSDIYDSSLKAQALMRGNGSFYGSNIYIPFERPSVIRGANIVFDEFGPMELLFTFTHADGKVSVKKFVFSRPIDGASMSFLYIGLENVVVCEIEGKGSWNLKRDLLFHIGSLQFLKKLPDLPCYDTSEFISSSLVENEATTISDSSLASSSLPEKSSVDQDSGPKDDKILPKHDSLTLTSASTIVPQCIIGSGGFGEVLLVKVDGIPFPCVLKKMLRVADKKVVKGCRKEFKVQLKLFTNPKCFNRIPRPLYIFDLLDADFHGVYGFLMEFCVGGSVSSFAKSWCADGKYVSVDEDEDESSDSDSDSDSPSSTPFNPMTLNPVKVCSLCVGMIECLDDVFTAKPKLIHRDIKPDNFLVRVDPDSKKCTVVLSDLGFVQIQDSISSSTSSKSFCAPPPSKLVKLPQKRSICGTLVYNSFQALSGIQSQASDGYSLGISILSLFLCRIPFFQIPVLRGIEDKMEFIDSLMNLIEKNRTTKLIDVPLFKLLLTIDDGKFVPVHRCLNEVFTGLTQKDEEDRMSVHQAKMKVQSIKPLLPEIGDGWEYPSIEDIISEQRKKYGGCGSISGLESVDMHDGWDMSKKKE